MLNLLVKIFLYLSINPKKDSNSRLLHNISYEFIPNFLRNIQILTFSFSGNNDAKPNNVESAGEGLVAGTSGMSSDPYEASVSAALSSMNINSEAASQGNFLRGIDNFLGAA